MYTLHKFSTRSFIHYFCYKQCWIQSFFLLLPGISVDDGRFLSLNILIPITAISLNFCTEIPQTPLHFLSFGKDQQLLIPPLVCLLHHKISDTSFYHQIRYRAYRYFTACVDHSAPCNAILK